jgi:hypothetical protein
MINQMHNMNLNQMNMVNNYPNYVYGYDYA